MGRAQNPTCRLDGCGLLSQLEARARQLEGRELGSAAGQSRGKPDLQRYDRDRQGANPALVTMLKAYNPDADITADVRSDVVKDKKKVGPIPCWSYTVRCPQMRGLAGSLRFWQGLSIMCDQPRCHCCSSSGVWGGVLLRLTCPYVWQKKKREEEAAAAVAEVDAEEAEASPKKKKVRGVAP